jgi:hypothetical protein
MRELEYEVVFIIGSVNVTTVAYVDEADFSDEGKIEDSAIRIAAGAIHREIGLHLHLDNVDQITATHTGTIG